MRKSLYAMFMAAVFSLCSLTVAGQVDVNQYLASAKKGDTEAMLALGGFYRFGYKDVPRDLDQAVYWYTKAAEAGNASAQVIMGEYYMQGELVSQDHGKAVKYFLAAAKQGDVDGAFYLAECYVEGLGVKADDDEATKWYRVAAEKGHGVAQFMYGRALVIVEKYAAAKEMLQKAYNSGMLDNYDKEQCRQMLELIDQL